MDAIFVSPDITACIGVRKTGDWFEGTVNVLQGPTAIRVQHVCLPLRDTKSEALRDARKDAKKLIVMWRDKVRL